VKFGHILSILLSMLVSIVAWHLSAASAQPLPPPSTGPIQIVAVTPSDLSPAAILGRQ